MLQTICYKAITTAAPTIASNVTPSIPDLAAAPVTAAALCFAPVFETYATDA